jgi:transposase
MATLSMDLRKRILKAYDRGDVSREQVARRFEVSLGMVKKLIQQRRHTGSIAPLHHRSGRKPVILDSHRREMRLLLAKQPDLTLEEIRARLGLGCTIQAIHYVLVDMGLTYKKRLSGPRSNPAPMSLGRAGSGAGSKRDSTRRASSFSTNQRPKRT